MQEAAKAWGEGKDVEWQDARQMWQPMRKDGFCFNTHILYRLKPEVTTSLHEKELRRVYYHARGFPDAGEYRADDTFNKALRAVADAAIKQYIKEQQK
jgi:hypothetical protein